TQNPEMADYAQKTARDPSRSLLSAESNGFRMTRGAKPDPERALIENLHFHDLRHEATSRLFEKGLAIQEVAAITGHKTWAMLKRYTHPRPEDLLRKLASV